jgi:hypothetical protein
METRYRKALNEFDDNFLNALSLYFRISRARSKSFGLRGREFSAEVSSMKFGAPQNPEAAPGCFLYTKHCGSEVLNFSTSKLKPTTS